MACHLLDITWSTDDIEHNAKAVLIVFLWINVIFL